MTDKDAAIGRKVMVDELNTINSYEAMADHASPEVAEVVRDIADEEKVHVGEAGAIIAANDKRAVPAMKEGVKEARGIMKSFDEMLEESFEKKSKNKGQPSGPKRQATGFVDKKSTTAGTNKYNQDLSLRGQPGEKAYTTKVRNITYDKDGNPKVKVNSQAPSGRGNRTTNENGTLGGTGKTAVAFRNQRIGLNKGWLEPTDQVNELGRRILRNTRTGQLEVEMPNSVVRADEWEMEQALHHYNMKYKDRMGNLIEGAPTFSEYWTASETDPNSWAYDSKVQTGQTYGEATGQDMSRGDAKSRINRVLAQVLSPKSKAYPEAYMQAAQELGLGSEPSALQQAQANKRTMEIMASKLTPMDNAELRKKRALLYENPELMEELIGNRMKPYDEAIADEEDIERISTNEQFQQDLDSGMSLEDALAAYDERMKDANAAQEIQRNQALSRERVAQEAEAAAEAEDAKRRENELKDQLDQEKATYDELKAAKDKLEDAPSNERLGAQIAHGDVGSAAVDDDTKAVMDRIAGIYRGFDPEDMGTWAGTLTPENIAFLNDQAAKASASLAEQYPEGLPSDIGKIKGFTAETPMIDPKLGANGTYPEDFRSRNLHGLIGMLGRAVDPNYKQKLAGRQIQSQATTDKAKLPGTVEGLKDELRQKGLNTGEYAGEGFPAAKQGAAKRGGATGSNPNMIEGKPVESTYGTGSKGKRGDGTQNPDGADRSARQPQKGDSGKPYDAKSKADKKEAKKEHEKAKDKDAEKDADMNKQSKIKPNKGAQAPAGSTKELGEDMEKELSDKGFSRSASFADMLNERIAKSEDGKGMPPRGKMELIRDPWRMTHLSVNDPVNVNGNDGKHITNGEGISVKSMPKNDGASGAVDTVGAQAKRKVETDGVSGSVDSKGTQPAASLPDDGVNGPVVKSFADMLTERDARFMKAPPAEAQEQMTLDAFNQNTAPARNNKAKLPEYNGQMKRSPMRPNSRDSGMVVQPGVQTPRIQDVTTQTRPGTLKDVEEDYDDLSDIYNEIETQIGLADKADADRKVEEARAQRAAMLRDRMSAKPASKPVSGYNPSPFSTLGINTADEATGDTSISDPAELRDLSAYSRTFTPEELEVLTQKRMSDEGLSNEEAISRLGTAHQAVDAHNKAIRNENFNRPANAQKPLIKSFDEMMGEKNGDSFEKVAPVELTPEVARNNLSFLTPDQVQMIYSNPAFANSEYYPFVSENVNALGGLNGYLNNGDAGTDQEAQDAFLDSLDPGHGAYNAAVEANLRGKTPRWDKH